jgi:hypothetical protein
MQMIAFIRVVANDIALLCYITKQFLPTSRICSGRPTEQSVDVVVQCGDVLLSVLVVVSVLLYTAHCDRVKH